jgi:hypothetical protein
LQSLTSNEIKKDEKGGAWSIWKMGNEHRILVRKPKNISLGRSGHRREHSVKIHMKEIAYEGMDWIKLE